MEGLKDERNLEETALPRRPLDLGEESETVLPDQYAAAYGEELSRTLDLDSWETGEAEAFRWLERLNPPAIVAPEGREGTSYRLSVPNNDLDVPGSYWARGEEPPDNKQPSNLRTMKELRPRWLRDKTLHYLWPTEESDWIAGQPHTELLCREGGTVRKHESGPR